MVSVWIQAAYAGQARGVGRANELVIERDGGRGGLEMLRLGAAEEEEEEEGGLRVEREEGGKRGWGAFGGKGVGGGGGGAGAAGL